MPTRARRQAKVGWKGKPLVPIVPERLRAALELNGIPRREAARRLGITPQALDYYVRPRNKKTVGERYRCRAPDRRALARMTNLPEAWLAGEMRRLPWARDRWEDLQSGVWPTLHDLVYSLRTSATPARPKHSTLRHLRLLVTALQDATGIRLPHHLGGVPAPATVGELNRLLTDIAAWLASPRPLMAKASRYGDELEMVERSWAFDTSDRPSIAQVVEYRLIGRCWEAWLRDTKRRLPAFSPQTPAAPVVQRRGRAGWSIRHPAPWNEWFRIEGALHQFLSLGFWRGRLLGGDPPRSNEELFGVPELGHALEAILKPWLEGNAPLDWNRNWAGKSK